MAVGLARNWWLLALRGALAVIFGILTIVYPASSLGILTLLFGGYVMADGIFSIIAGAKAPSGDRRWIWLIVGGILGILVGIGTFFWPSATVFALTVWIAVWAIFVGIAQIATAVRLRKEIEGEFWLILGGTLSVLFGIFALINPLAGALAITTVIGFYAILFGIFLLLTAFRLRGWHERSKSAA